MESKLSMCLSLLADIRLAYMCKRRNRRPINSLCIRGLQNLLIVSSTVEFGSKSALREETELGLVNNPMPALKLAIFSAACMLRVFCFCL